MGLEIPVINMVHQYLVTENLDEVRGLDREPPVLRDPRASCYYRQEQDGILIGPYEMGTPRRGAWTASTGASTPSCCLPTSTVSRPRSGGPAKRMPAFENAGIKRIVSGPITHCPDGNFLLGPAPAPEELLDVLRREYRHHPGSGAGKYLAQWMIHGQTEINMLGFDPRRYGDWSAGRYALEKSIDEYQQMYQVAYPGEYREDGRPVKTTPIHEKLKAAGAVFAETFGWERSKWFAPPGVEERYSFRRTNWFEPSRQSAERCASAWACWTCRPSPSTT